MQHVQAFLSSLELESGLGSSDLTVFHLISRTSHEPGYDTLQDAILAGHARVTEVSKAGSVPELRVVNDGSRAVLIVDGEELVGAKQNRIVNITIMVPAKTALTIPVSCVEAGRWSVQSAEFAPAERTYHASGRRAKVEQVSASLRMYSSRHADQSAIWGEIDAKSARLGAASSTRAAAAMFDKMRERLEAFTNELQPVKGQVGAVFAIRGAIVGLDAFDSARTWARVMPGLVRSYGLDALDTAVGGNGFAKPDAHAFVDAIASAPLETFPAVGLGSDARVSGDAVVGGALVVADRVVHILAFPKNDATQPKTHRHWGGMQ
jgi:hypothetical protein